MENLNQPQPMMNRYRNIIAFIAVACVVVVLGIQEYRIHHIETTQQQYAVDSNAIKIAVIQSQLHNFNSQRLEIQKVEPTYKITLQNEIQTIQNNPGDSAQLAILQRLLTEHGQLFSTEDK
jgi:hypothetical protein